MTSKPRLGAAESDALSPILQRVYAQQATALRSAQKMLESFKGWIDAAHFYRREEGAEEPSQPPLQLATYLVGSGSMHLRHRQAAGTPATSVMRAVVDLRVGVDWAGSLLQPRPTSGRGFFLSVEMRALSLLRILLTETGFQ